MCHNKGRYVTLRNEVYINNVPILKIISDKEISILLAYLLLCWGHFNFQYHLEYLSEYVKQFCSPLLNRFSNSFNSSLLNTWLVLVWYCIHGKHHIPQDHNVCWKLTTNYSSTNYNEGHRNRIGNGIRSLKESTLLWWPGLWISCCVFGLLVSVKLVWKLPKLSRMPL